MHLDKKNKRKLFYFLETLFLTFVAGMCFLGVYMFIQSKEASGLNKTDEVLDEIVTDQPIENEIQRDDGNAEVFDEIGEINEIEDTQEGVRDENSMDAISQDESSQDVASQGEAVLTFGGDICFYDAYSNMNALFNRGGKIERCISLDLLNEMKNSDICMVNNEFPYSDRGEPLPDKTYTFRSRPENVRLLSEMGVDIVSIANNHAYDYGEEAFLDTLDTLANEPGVVYVGGGKNLDEASSAAYFTIDGLKIGYIAASQIERQDKPDTKGATESQPGVMRCFNEKELNNLLSAIENAKKKCDFLVVYIHWGTENTDVLDWAQPYQANLISKAGADLIVGSHPHCLQGIDVVNNVPVIYSLGNFWFNSKKIDTVLLKVVIDKNGVNTLQLIPAIQENCSTSILLDEEKGRVLDYLKSLSPNIIIDDNGVVTW